MYGVPAGKLEGCRTEWKTDVILPVLCEMTIVAAVSRLETTAREEASTVIEGCCVIDIVVMWCNGYVDGVPLGTRARLFIPKLNTHVRYRMKAAKPSHFAR